MAKLNRNSLPPIDATQDDTTGTTYWYADVSKLDAPRTIAKMRRQNVGVSFRKKTEGEKTSETVYFQSDYMFLAICREHMGMLPPDEEEKPTPGEDKSTTKATTKKRAG